jgi:NADPH:quinone reductase-like Zn-dependent oxidoreductase
MSTATLIRSDVATTTGSRAYRFDLPEVIELEEIERSVPCEGKVLARVHAAGVGPWDAWVRSGRSMLPQPVPLTPGSDLCAVVAEVVPGVAAFRPCQWWR